RDAPEKATAESDERLEMLLGALCREDFAFFEEGMALAAGISPENARTLLTDRGELGFRALYNQSGLPDAMFGGVRLLFASARSERGKKDFAKALVKRLARHADGENSESMAYIIALARRAAA